MAGKRNDIPEGGKKVIHSDGNSTTWDKDGELHSADIDGKKYGKDDPRR